MTEGEGDMNRLCIDLCSGLGGLSQAFMDAGWDVITVDIEAKFKPTYIMDIRNLVERPDDYSGFWLLKPRVILTSPPCERMSMATDWPQPGIYEGMSVIGACLEIVARLRPQFWGLENPSTGRLRWFIGAPTNRVRLNAFGYRSVKPTGLWGNIPLGFLKNDSSRKNPVAKNYFANGPRNPAIRAKMPLGFSQAILKAVNTDGGN